MTKKFGVAGLQEQLERNREYFENLQKCYNPSEVDSKVDFERSRSSEGILQNSLTLEQKIADLIGNKESVSLTENIKKIDGGRMKMLKRSQTYSVLSMYRKRLDSGELRLASPFAKILEKGESLDVGQDVEDIDHDDGEEDTLQKLRGILKNKLKAESVVRTIKFTMESQDQLGEERTFEKKTRKTLRSPPLTPRNTLVQTNTEDSSEEEEIDVSETAKLINEPRTKINNLKAKLPLNPGSTVHLSNYERYLEETFSSLEPDSASQSSSSNQPVRQVKSNPSPLPQDVGLSDLERKSIQRRLSVRPNFTR